MPRQMFNSFWYGNELSPLEWACLNSFIEHEHGFRLFCYEPIPVPNGVLLEDASRIAPKDELFVVKEGIAAFSDLFRYKVIQRYGEWWADTDVYCLKDDIPDCDYAWANEDQNHINGAVLKFPSNDPTLFDISRAAHAIGSKTGAWCELGPHLLTKHLAGRAFDNHFGKREYFYPIHWLETFLYWLPHQNDCVRFRCKDSFFLHLWNSVFAQMGIDRYTMPPVGSFLDAIYSPHISRFNLRELEVDHYKRTIELMKTFVNEMRKWSERKLGYDVSEYPFDDFIGLVVTERPATITDIRELQSNSRGERYPRA
jgi:hypothetical protein